MTQEHPPYFAGASHASEGNASFDPAIFKRFNETGYRPPSVDELRSLKEFSGLTGGELAKLAGVDARTWRKWTAPPDNEKGSFRQIPYAAWRLLLIELGLLRENRDKLDNAAEKKGLSPKT